MSSKRFTVGQNVIRARRGGYGDAPVEFETMTIVKVGTRYVYAKRKNSTMNLEERFDTKTGEGTTYRSNEVNEIWETRKAFEAAQIDLETRQQFARAMRRWSMFGTEEVPLENIKQAAELLGIELDKQ